MLDRVPYEIFSKIIKFSYTSLSFHSFNSSLDRDEINVPPIKATHVCRSWRTALLSDQTMWTRIILTGGSKMCLDQLNETLHRSGSCPLHVLVDHYGDWLHSYFVADLWHMLCVVSQEMHRCRQLEVVISAQLVPLVSLCLVKPAPMLQKFYLEVLDENNFGQKDMIKRIHQILFSGNAPNLEHVRLQISGGLDNLQSSLFKNLSSLYLHFVPGTVVDRDRLLDIFQSSPCLRVLIILWCYIEQDPALSMRSNRRIPLPHLRDLLLQGGNVAGLVLRHLEFPVENIKFNITWGDSRIISESTFLLNLLSQRRLTFLSIHSHVFLLHVDFSEKMDQGFAGSTFGTMCGTGHNTHAPMNDLPKYLRTFNLSDITHMSLQYLSLKYVILRSILVSLANLRYLRIHHGSLDECLFLQGSVLYLKALLPPRQPSNPQIQTRASSELDTEDSDTDPESSIVGTCRGQLFPCPSLRTLELFFSDDPSSVELDEAYLRALFRCSKIREQAGYPLKYIANCSKPLDLEKDIEAWLQAHEGFPIEVRAAK